MSDQHVEASQSSDTHSVWGRKIFFLNPHESLFPVISDLRAAEYEIYTIENYRDVKGMLKRYPDSMLFINVDDQLPHESWLNFVLSLKEDQAFSNVLVGLLTHGLKKEITDKFMKYADLTGGIINVSESRTLVLHSINSVLKINNAKGRRKYVRAICVGDTKVQIIITVSGKMYVLKVFDISTVGVACSTKQSMDITSIKPKTIFRRSTIALNGVQYAVDLLVLAIKPNKDENMLVCLFMPGMQASIKQKIRSYVFSTLQKRLLNSVLDMPKDTQDYTKESALLSLPDKNEASDTETQVNGGHLKSTESNAHDAGHLSENGQFTSLF